MELHWLELNQENQTSSRQPDIIVTFFLLLKVEFLPNPIPQMTMTSLFLLRVINLFSMLDQHAGMVLCLEPLPEFTHTSEFSFLIFYP